LIGSEVGEEIFPLKEIEIEIGSENEKVIFLYDDYHESETCYGFCFFPFYHDHETCCVYGHHHHLCTHRLRHQYQTCHASGLQVCVLL
jgi:hypothetical protein